MASTHTRTELIVKVLEKLGVIAAGQQPEIEDRARVDANLDDVIAELPEREIVDIQDVDAIPNAYFLSVAAICAWELRNEFGLTGESLAELKNENDSAIIKLQTMVRVRPTGQPARPDFC